MLLKTNYDEKFHLKYIKFLGMKKREKLDDFNNHQNHHFYGYNLP